MVSPERILILQQYIATHENHSNLFIILYLMYKVTLHSQATIGNQLFGHYHTGLFFFIY